MATKRTDKATTMVYTDGTETTLRIMDFFTPEDYVDLATQAQILEVRGGPAYEPELVSRAVKDTFLRLNLSSGIAEVNNGDSHNG